MSKFNTIVKRHLSVSFPFKLPLKEESVLKNIKNGFLFGYVQCDNEVLENLWETFANFSPIFKKINVGMDDTGSFVQEHTEKKMTFNST